LITPRTQRYAAIAEIHRLNRQPEPAAIHDVDGHAHRRLVTMKGIAPWEGSGYRWACA
jgi:hypothetical protein